MQGGTRAQEGDPLTSPEPFPAGHALHIVYCVLPDRPSLHVKQTARHATYVVPEKRGDMLAAAAESKCRSFVDGGRADQDLFDQFVRQQR